MKVKPNPQYERKTYAVAKLYVEEGWYTKAQIEQLLMCIEVMNKNNEKSMEKILGTP